MAVTARPAPARDDLANPQGTDIPNAGYKPKPYRKDPDDSRACSSCDRMNSPDAKFCDQCGAEIQPNDREAYSQDADENVRCPTCVCMNDDDAEYCDQCGYMLTGRGDVIQASARPRRGDLAPRENLVRGVWPVRMLRDGGGSMPLLTGHFAVFNRWTHIESFWEGDFMEQVAPGAFTKTFKDNRSNMRCLFAHGMDMQIGDKVLGPIRELEEDDIGARYVVPMIDTSYNADLIPGLDAEQYGASFRFRVVREEFNKSPDPSEHNPLGIPERTVLETETMEFGPCTFPAYQDATAGLDGWEQDSRFDPRNYRTRSWTDSYIERRLLRMFGSDPERAQNFLRNMERREPIGQSAPTEEQAAIAPVEAIGRILVARRVAPMDVDAFIAALEN